MFTEYYLECASGVFFIYISAYVLRCVYVSNYACPSWVEFMKSALAIAGIVKSIFSGLLIFKNYHQLDSILGYDIWLLVLGGISIIWLSMSILNKIFFDRKSKED